MSVSTYHHNTTVTKPVNRIGFLLLDNFTMLALASAVDPLRMANQLTGKELYDWYTISENGQTVTASDGISVIPDSSMADAPLLDTLIVVGGVNITRSFTSKQIYWLQSLARKHVKLGASAQARIYLLRQDYLTVISAACIGSASRLCKSAILASVVSTTFL
ncbi:AraC family transcriptional regulator [Vibrio zhugei]|uniref:AraC family transcriptional regulator n=1 Tax=Vibrio zhugei TaxID=2479546 RepID=A0ABV7CB53_9VIBR|nr:AraC family transcriptional regulator [Vibrio zhugei]